MSVLTDLLKLFKYDPEADKSLTFNIRQALNENWDKLETWADGVLTRLDGVDTSLSDLAAATDPDDTKATPVDADSLVLSDSTDTGKKKRVTWANLKLALGAFFAALNHGHAIEDVADLSATLSNKANAIRVLDSGDISQLVPLKSTGVATTPDVTGVPYAAWWVGDAVTTGTVFRVDLTNVHYPMKSYRRTYQNGSWTDWVPIATATPPQELYLPLAEGWTHINDSDPLRYGKCGDGSVQVMGIIIVPPGTVGGQQIATLPLC